MLNYATKQYRKTQIAKALQMNTVLNFSMPATKIHKALDNLSDRAHRKWHVVQTRAGKPYISSLDMSEYRSRDNNTLSVADFC